MEQNLSATVRNFSTLARDGKTSIDPRIETGHDATESFHAESGSGQKTATAHGVNDHEKSALLTANGKRSESESDGDVHESYPLVT